MMSADAALAASALLMGLAGTPHCLAMCGPACGALARGCAGVHRGRALLALHLARLMSYAAAGAIVAGGMGALAYRAPQLVWLRPLWLALQLGALYVGLTMLWQARQPAWLGSIGRRSAHVVALPATRRGTPRRVGPPQAALAGLLWSAWPCGLLQSALLLAALASAPAVGSAVMTLFAIGSGIGLAAGPLLWARLAGVGRWQAASVRLAGAVLAAASLWALLSGATASAGLFCTPPR
jgi:sulfite exporter TauE/SafE